MDRNERMEHFKRQLYSNFTDYNSQEIINACQELQVLLLTASPDIRHAYRSTEIDAYKFLSEATYLQKNYQECLSYINNIKLSPLYASEPEESHLHTEVRSFQCLTMLSIYSNNQKKIETLLSEAADYYRTYKEKLVVTLAEDMRKNIDLLQSYINHTITSSSRYYCPIQYQLIRIKP